MRFALIGYGIFGVMNIESFDPLNSDLNRMHESSFLHLLYAGLDFAPASQHDRLTQQLHKMLQSSRLHFHSSKGCRRVVIVFRYKNKLY